jgi:hypothetical protein
MDCFRSHLGDKNNRARANAALLLHVFSPNEAFETLHKMVLSENNLMRASSALALGQVQSEKRAAILIDVLQLEKEEMVVFQVIRTLCRLAKGFFPIYDQITKTLASLEKNEAIEAGDDVSAVTDPPAKEAA